MDILKRTIAPITADAWSQIDAQAARVLTPLLSARRLVDVEGPFGWDFAALTTGRLDVPSAQPKDGVQYGVYKVQPLVEVRVPFELDIWEVDNIVRGAADVDFGGLEDAARKLAAFEDKAVYFGFTEGLIKGLAEASTYEPVELPKQHSEILEKISFALTKFLERSIGGPYAMVVSPSLWFTLSGHVEGYPLKKHLESMLGGPVVLGHFIDGAILVSTRGGDNKLTLGQDIAIGYKASDKHKVQLFLTESFTFQIFEPAACMRLTWK